MFARRMLHNLRNSVVAIYFGKWFLSFEFNYLTYDNDGIRFYDNESKNCLSYEQFKKLLRQIRKGKKLPLDDAIIENEAKLFAL